MLLGKGTKEEPWNLTTPSGGSEFQAWRDESLDPPALVVQVGKTQLRYALRARGHHRTAILLSHCTSPPSACRWRSPAPRRHRRNRIG